jgi:hypothetical protein
MAGSGAAPRTQTYAGTRTYKIRLTHNAANYVIALEVFFLIILADLEAQEPDGHEHQTNGNAEFNVYKYTDRNHQKALNDQNRRPMPIPRTMGHARTHKQTNSTVSKTCVVLPVHIDRCI